MSIKRSFPKFSIYFGLKAQENYPYDYYHNLKKPNSVFYKNLVITSTSTVEILKKKWNPRK